MPQPLILYKVIPNTQKAVATAGGFALVALVVTPVGKRVFLLIVTTITTVMHDMTPAATTVKKAALGRSKSPPLAVQKQQLVDDPPNSPKGWDFILAAFVEVVVALISLGEGSAGVFLGWLVTYVTWSRINCYVLTCLMSRAFVSYDTSLESQPRRAQSSSL